MLGAMFRLFWNSSKRVNPCKASRIIRIPPLADPLEAARNGTGHLAEAFTLHIENVPSNYHYASDMPTEFRCAVRPLERRQPKLLRPYYSNYHDASDFAELEPTFRQVPIMGNTSRHIRRWPSCEIWNDPYSARIPDNQSKTGTSVAVTTLHITKSATNVFIKGRLL